MAEMSPPLARTASRTSSIVGAEWPFVDRAVAVPGARDSSNSSSTSACSGEAVDPVDAAAQPLVRRQPLGEHLVAERLDQVVHRAELHRRTDRCQVAGGRDDHDVGGVRLLEQGAHDSRPLPSGR